MPLAITTDDELAATEQADRTTNAAAVAHATTTTERTARATLVAADAAAVAVGGVGALALVRLIGDGRIDVGLHVWATVAALPVWLGALAHERLHRVATMWTSNLDVRRIARASLLALIVMMAIAFAAGSETSRGWLALVAVLVPGLLLAERALVRTRVVAARRVGQLRRRILVVGTDASAMGLVAELRATPDAGCDVVGLLGPERVNVIDGAPLLGSVDDVEQVLMDTAVDGVIISTTSVPVDRLNRLTRDLTDAGYQVALTTSLRDIDLARLRPRAIGTRSLIDVDGVVRTGWRTIAKRTFDIAVALAVLVLTAPLVAVAVMAIRHDSSGRAIFTQWRVGKDGRLFRIFKLRTMTADAEARKAELLAQNEADGALFKMSADPRVTRVGRILRRTSIDELPQLINVLRGEMSIVGPRPALPAEVEQWDDELSARLRVPPGITGLWQVSGRSDTSFDEYKRLDLYYVDNWRLSHDLGIVFRTAGVVLASKGAR